MSQQVSIKDWNRHVEQIRSCDQPAVFAGAELQIELRQTEEQRLVSEIIKNNLPPLRFYGREEH